MIRIIKSVQMQFMYSIIRFEFIIVYTCTVNVYDGLFKCIWCIIQLKLKCFACIIQMVWKHQLFQSNSQTIQMAINSDEFGKLAKCKFSDDFWETLSIYFFFFRPRFRKTMCLWFCFRQTMSLWFFYEAKSFSKQNLG